MTLWLMQGREACSSCICCQTPARHCFGPPSKPLGCSLIRCGMHPEPAGGTSTSPRPPSLLCSLLLLMDRQVSCVGRLAKHPLPVSTLTDVVGSGFRVSREHVMDVCGRQYHHQLTSPPPTCCRRTHSKAAEQPFPPMSQPLIVLRSDSAHGHVGAACVNVSEVTQAFEII